MHGATKLNISCIKIRVCHSEMIQKQIVSTSVIVDNGDQCFEIKLHVTQEEGETCGSFLFVPGL